MAINLNKTAPNAKTRTISRTVDEVVPYLEPVEHAGATASVERPWKFGRGRTHCIVRLSHAWGDKGPKVIDVATDCYKGTVEVYTVDEGQGNALIAFDTDAIDLTDYLRAHGWTVRKA